MSEVVQERKRKFRLLLRDYVLRHVQGSSGVFKSTTVWHPYFPGTLTCVNKDLFWSDRIFNEIKVSRDNETKIEQVIKEAIEVSPADRYALEIMAELIVLQEAIEDLTEEEKLVYLFWFDKHRDPDSEGNVVFYSEYLESYVRNFYVKEDGFVAVNGDKIKTAEDLGAIKDIQLVTKISGILDLLQKLESDNIDTFSPVFTLSKCLFLIDIISGYKRL